MKNYINDETTQCTEAQTRKLVSILQEWGWEVAYGTSTGWKFTSDRECDDFHNAFGKAFNLATIEASGIDGEVRANHTLVIRLTAEEYTQVREDCALFGYAGNEWKDYLVEGARRQLWEAHDRAEKIRKEITHDILRRNAELLPGGVSTAWAIRDGKPEKGPQNINAVKYLRGIYGLGLRDAVDIIGQGTGLR